MTEFNLLRVASDGQLFLHCHLEDESTFIVSVDGRDLTDLKDTLENPPESIDR